MSNQQQQQLQEQEQPLPSPAVAVQQVLHSMGAEEHEPRVVNLLVDFMYRYVSDTLQDAETYSEHAGKPPGQVDLDDVMLAIQARSAFTFAQPPDQNEIAQLAAVANDKGMPHYPHHKHGLQIPDDKECLTAQNYQLG